MTRACWKPSREQLPLLAARMEQERTHATMLRPASAPADPPQTLLRPAYGAAETEPQQLLRASNGSDASAASGE